MNSASAVLLKALDEQRPAQFSGKSWGRARLFLAKSLSVVPLSFDAQGKVQGLAPDYLAQMYRRFCDTRGGGAVNLTLAANGKMCFIFSKPLIFSGAIGYLNRCSRHKTIRVLNAGS